MQEAAETIRQLEKDTVSVGVILDVIENIASKTNLFALTAAIEAARVGEHGREISVVADEVCMLELSNQESTEEIAKSVGIIHG